MQIPENVVFSRAGKRGGCGEGKDFQRPKLSRKAANVPTAAAGDHQALVMGRKPVDAPAPMHASLKPGSSDAPAAWSQQSPIQHDQEARRLTYFRQLLVQDMASGCVCSDSEKLLRQVDRELQRHWDALDLVQFPKAAQGSSFASTCHSLAAHPKRLQQWLAVTHSKPQRHHPSSDRA